MYAIVLIFVNQNYEHRLKFELSPEVNMWKLLKD